MAIARILDALEHRVDLKAVGGVVDMDINGQVEGDIPILRHNLGVIHLERESHVLEGIYS